MDMVGECAVLLCVLTYQAGLTETSPVTHKLPLEYAKSHSGYIGRMLSNTTARIVNVKGQDVPGDNKSSGE